MCKSIDDELSRLQALYQAAGDPTLSPDAWAALVTVADEWTEYSAARRKLYSHIRDAGLPLP